MVQYQEAARDIKAAATRHLYDRQRGHFIRRLTIRQDGTMEADPTLDASVTALVRLGMYGPHDPMIVRTMAAVKDRLWCRTAVGGLARYECAPYFLHDQDAASVPGNPWFICRMWLAQYHIACSRTVEDLEPALALLHWVEGHALRSGVLAEQIQPRNGAPLSVWPLTWSHAEFVLTVHQYLARQRVLGRRSARIRTGVPLATVVPQSDRSAATRRGPC